MSNTEKKITDTQGQYLQAMEDGQRLEDATWEACRVILTTERIVLVGEEKRELPLSAIDRIAERYDVNQQTATVSDFVTVYYGEDIVLLTASDYDAFETDLFRATLNGEIVLVKHPAVEGGVVKDSEWRRGRTKVSDDALELALEDGEAFAVERADIGDLAVDEEGIAGEERTVIEVEHTQDGISVETHLASEAFHATVLQVMLEEGAARNRADLDLTNTEARVVMALHSGVSPFDIPEFCDVSVERTEEIFDRLIEYDVIDVVRERSEVELSTRGRRVAGETMGE